MSAQVFAHTVGVPYFHSPMVQVDHAPEGEANWAARWEDAFRLGEGFEPVPRDVPLVSLKDFLKTSPVASVDDFPNNYKPVPPVISASRYQEFCDRCPDLYLQYQANFRARCRLVGETTPTAAVHIRRGDVAIPGSSFAHRLTPMNSIGRTISIIQKARPDLSIHVYSEGERDDFADLPEGCTFHLNTDVFESLRGMINAAVLVTAKSSFSYIAALLSRGVVLFEPFWHRPLSHWVICSKNGHFEPATLSG